MSDDETIRGTPFFPESAESRDLKQQDRLSQPITTRRAIEVCMSRLPMDEGTRKVMAYHLYRACMEGMEREFGPPASDVDAMRALCADILSLASGVDMSFDKRGMLSRFASIRDRASRALEVTS